MRRLVFTAIVDSRLDGENLEYCMEKRREDYKRAIESIGCSFKVSQTEAFFWPPESPYYATPNTNVVVPKSKKQRVEIERQLGEKYGDSYELVMPKPTRQLRCTYWVQKVSSRITWNDVMAAINSVKAVYYKMEAAR